MFSDILARSKQINSEGKEAYNASNLKSHFDKVNGGLGKLFSSVSGSKKSQDDTKQDADILKELKSINSSVSKNPKNNVESAEEKAERIAREEKSNQLLSDLVEETKKRNGETVSKGDSGAGGLGDIIKGLGTAIGGIATGIGELAGALTGGLARIAAALVGRSAVGATAGVAASAAGSVLSKVPGLKLVGKGLKLGAIAMAGDALWNVGKAAFGSGDQSDSAMSSIRESANSGMLSGVNQAFQTAGHGLKSMFSAPEQFAESQVTGGDDATIEKILATIRKRESGGNYTAHSNGSSASGAYQFIDRTWVGLTKQFNVGTSYEHASDAPPQVQDEVARRYVKDILAKNGGDVTKVPLVWYTGNAQGKMSAAQMAANNGLSASTYQQKWMTSFSGQSGSTQVAQTSAAPSKQNATAVVPQQKPTQTAQAPTNPVVQEKPWYAKLGEAALSPFVSNANASEMDGFPQGSTPAQQPAPIQQTPSKQDGGSGWGSIGLALAGGALTLATRGKLKSIAINKEYAKSIKHLEPQTGLTSKFFKNKGEKDLLALSKAQSNATPDKLIGKSPEYVRQRQEAVKVAQERVDANEKFKASAQIARDDKLKELENQRLFSRKDNIKADKETAVASAKERATTPRLAEQAARKEVRAAESNVKDLQDKLAKARRQHKASSGIASDLKEAEAKLVEAKATHAPLRQVRAEAVGARVQAVDELKAHKAPSMLSGMREGVKSRITTGVANASEAIAEKGFGGAVKAGAKSIGGKMLGTAGLAVAGGVDYYQASSEIDADEQLNKQQKEELKGNTAKRITSGLAGSLAGGAAGAALGAGLGTMLLPGFGTAAGGFIGMLGGSIVGDEGVKQLYDKLYGTHEEQRSKMVNGVATSTTPLKTPKSRDELLQDAYHSDKKMQDIWTRQSETRSRVSAATPVREKATEERKALFEKYTKKHGKDFAKNPEFAKQYTKEMTAIAGKESSEMANLEAMKKKKVKPVAETDKGYKEWKKSHPTKTLNDYNSRTEYDVATEKAIAAKLAPLDKEETARKDEIAKGIPGGKKKVPSALPNVAAVTPPAVDGAPSGTPVTEEGHLSTKLMDKNSIERKEWDIHHGERTLEVPANITKELDEAGKKSPEDRQKVLDRIMADEKTPPETKAALLRQDYSKVIESKDSKQLEVFKQKAGADAVRLMDAANTHDADPDKLARDFINSTTRGKSQSPSVPAKADAFAKKGTDVPAELAAPQRAADDKARAELAVAPREEAAKINETIGAAPKVEASPTKPKKDRLDISEEDMASASAVKTSDLQKAYDAAKTDKEKEEIAKAAAATGHPLKLKEVEKQRPKAAATVAPRKEASPGAVAPVDDKYANDSGVKTILAMPAGKERDTAIANLENSMDKTMDRGLVQYLKQHKDDRTPVAVTPDAIASPVAQAGALSAKPVASITAEVVGKASSEVEAIKQESTQQPAPIVNVPAPVVNIQGGGQGQSGPVKADSGDHWWQKVFGLHK